MSVDDKAKPETTVPSWLVEPDRLPNWLRRLFDASLAVVFFWFVAQMGYWLAFGAANPGPFPNLERAGLFVALAAWGLAIAIRWGYSCIHPAGDARRG